MIQFNFTGNPYPSFDEQTIAKQLFIEKLGPFKEEFEEAQGVVTFDYSKPETDIHRIAFQTAYPHSLPDFIKRWNEYILSIGKDNEE